MPDYKLSYFDLRGMGEHIRLMFVAAGVPFEDNRVQPSDWATLKGETKFGQMPVLEFDGEVLTQSFAIGRYLGRKFKMGPEDDLLVARCDEVAHHALELQLRFREFYMEYDADQKAELKENLATLLMPKYYPVLEELVSANPGDFIAGGKPSWQDFFLANWLQIWEETIVGPDYMNDFPGLKAQMKAIFSIPAVKIYVGKRNPTYA